MLTFTVADIAAATGAVLVAGSGDVPVTSVVTDSRAAGEGALFVCIPGERVDGNDFALGVAASGAAAVALTREPADDLLAAAAETGCAVLRAAEDDPTEFMLRLAGAWRQRNPQWAVVGVTGSVGKTTTKEMLAAGLSSSYRVHKTSGNFNNLLGVPITLLSADPDDQVVVVEMGMNHAGELTRLTHAVRPDVAVITNVGTSHIGLLGSRENIARAKAEIVAGMGKTDEPSATCIGKVSPCLYMTSDNDFAGLIEDAYCKPAGLGEVGELGTEARRLHGYIGAYAAAKAPDLIVWVGGADAREMREAATVMGMSEDKMELFPDAAQALKIMAPVLAADDLVLVKASRSVGLDAFVKGVLG